MKLVTTHANDLQRLAQKHNWEVGPLTYTKVSRMSSQELNFHEVFNKVELAKALDEPRVSAETKRNEETARTEQYWKDGRATEETINEVKKFCAGHPQFRGDVMGNRTALIDHLKASNLPVTQDMLTEAFQTLGREGKLVLNPSTVGIIRVRYSNGQVLDIRQEDLGVHQRRNPGLTVLEPETAITGARLSRSLCLDILLSPHNSAIQQKRERGAISADEFKQKSILNQPTPAEQAERAKRERRDAETFLSFHPECSNCLANWDVLLGELRKGNLAASRYNFEAVYPALVEAERLVMNSDTVATSGVTKVVDYGAQPRAAHELPEEMKASLRYKVRSMPSAEYNVWIQNPANKKAVDEAFT